MERTMVCIARHLYRNDTMYLYLWKFNTQDINQNKQASGWR